MLQRVVGLVVVVVVVVVVVGASPLGKSGEAYPSMNPQTTPSELSSHKDPSVGELDGGGVVSNPESVLVAGDLTGNSHTTMTNEKENIM